MAAITQHQTASNETFANPTTQQIRFIRKREVMHLTGLPSSTIYDLMSRDLFPKSIKLAGGKEVAWSLSSIQAWQQQCLASQD